MTEEELANNLEARATSYRECVQDKRRQLEAKVLCDIHRMSYGTCTGEEVGLGSIDKVRVRMPSGNLLSVERNYVPAGSELYFIKYNEIEVLDRPVMEKSRLGEELYKLIHAMSDLKRLESAYRLVPSKGEDDYV